VSFHNIFAILKKEFRGGLKDPLFLMVFILPFVFTIVIQLIFGNLWTQKTAIAMFQEGGGSAIIQEFRENEAIKTIELSSVDAVYNEVKNKKADIGVIFPENLEERLKNNEKVVLKVYINGESLAKNRTIAGTAIADTLRALYPGSPSINYQEIQIGEEKPLNVIQLTLPLIILIAILFGSYMLSATFIVKEKEKKTLSALLVTPLSPAELLIAFGLLGTILSLFVSLMILFLNVGFKLPGIIFIPLVLGSLLGAEWGLILGIFLRDMSAVFATMKSLNIVLIAPALILMFPNWPQWIAKIFPTYYVINPIFRISVFNDSFGKVSLEIYVLIGLVILFFFTLLSLSKRLMKSY
jgi:ABC-2 type transport system permease protein